MVTPGEEADADAGENGNQAERGKSSAGRG
jgi:hypothetical protein